MLSNTLVGTPQFISRQVWSKLINFYEYVMIINQKGSSMLHVHYVYMLNITQSSYLLWYAHSASRQAFRPYKDKWAKEPSAFSGSLAQALKIPKAERP